MVLWVLAYARAERWSRDAAQRILFAIPVVFSAEGTMKTIMVRYKTSPEQADTNEALVRAVFAELGAQRPGGLRYASYRLADGAFVHIATVERLDENPLTALPAFKTFQKDLRARCVELPVVTEMSPVGAYAAAELAVAAGAP
jgi:hypothetical protein